MVSFRSSVSRVTPANRKGINTTFWVFLSQEVETIKQLLRVADSFGHKLLSSFANDVHYLDGLVFTNGQPCTTELKSRFQSKPFFLTNLRLASSSRHSSPVSADGRHSNPLARIPQVCHLLPDVEPCNRLRFNERTNRLRSAGSGRSGL